MRFAPFIQAGYGPNVIVDGSATENTVLTLSHWPKSGTPPELRGDTSAEVVFNYLDSPGFHVEADIVSNNHFDEDGLVGVFTMVEPSIAKRHRELLIQVAKAGDFGVVRSREAARIAFTIAAWADPDTSPLPESIFKTPYAEMAAGLYLELLKLLPNLLTNLNDYQTFWEAEDDALTVSEALMRDGIITIAEQPDLDFAVVRIPENLNAHRVHRFTQARMAECHPFALHNATNCTKLLVATGNNVELQHRYESWVQMFSRRPAPRVDLSPLANELNQMETAGGRWVFDGVDRITPKLHLDGNPATSIPLETIIQRVEHHLRTCPPAWNPYD